MKQPTATANRSESIFFACNKRLNDMQPAQGQQMDVPQVRFVDIAAGAHNKAKA